MKIEEPIVFGAEPEKVLETLKGLLYVHQRLQKEWLIRNGDDPTDTGFSDEIGALLAAVASIRTHGVPTRTVEINLNLDDEIPGQGKIRDILEQRSE